MASYLDKTKINTAITDNTKLDLGHQHITTADFMQLNVGMIQELVPGESIDIKMETFARLNPLPVPTFGRARLINRAFAVPFRTIFRGWNDFITDNVHVFSDGVFNGSALLSRVPTVTMEDLVSAFINNAGTAPTDNALVYQLPSTATVYDIVWGANNNMYNYTIRGRQCIKLLEQLGYKLDYNVTSSTDARNTTFSALPLLALAKIYVDWYWPNQYTDTAFYDRLLSFCNFDLNTGPLQLVSADVSLILELCSYVCYDSDYFVSAFDTPNQPHSDVHSDFKLVNIDSVKYQFGTFQTNTTSYTYGENGYVTNNSGGSSASNHLGYADAPFISPYANDSSGTRALPTPISEYLLHSLHALTDYMKRHQMAGARVFDRYLARFGKALPAEKMNRSVYLGAAMQNIQIGDVMSTADTSTANLGAYSGKGLSYGNGHFSYDTDEFCYVIVLSSIVPAAGYFQGIDRQVMRTSKLQFWTPEFDSLGCQPITADELFIPQIHTEMPTGVPHEQVFGFTPRYADYKVSHDGLTGNFRLKSLSTGGFLTNSNDAWHLMRTFNGLTDFGGSYANVIHHPNFVRSTDYSQYKRLFYDTNPDAPDNFTIIHNFEIAAQAPMKALYDTYEFEDKGKQVTLEVNGVKMN